MRREVGNSLPRLLRKLGKRAADFVQGGKSSVENHIVNGERKKCVRLAAKIGDAVQDGRVDDGVRIEPVGNGFVVALEQILVNAAAFIKQLQCGFEAFCELIDRGRVQTLVIDAADFKNDACLAGLRKKDVPADEPEQIDLLAE